MMCSVPGAGGRRTPASAAQPRKASRGRQNVHEGHGPGLSTLQSAVPFLLGPSLCRQGLSTVCEVSRCGDCPRRHHQQVEAEDLCPALLAPSPVLFALLPVHLT